MGVLHGLRSPGNFGNADSEIAAYFALGHAFEEAFCDLPAFYNRSQFARREHVLQQGAGLFRGLYACKHAAKFV